MIRSRQISEILSMKLTKGNWISIEQVYGLIEKYANLDSDDFEWQSPTSSIPKWKRNVRNVLQKRKTKDIEWDGHAKYRLS